MKLSLKPIFNFFIAVVSVITLFTMLLVSCNETPSPVDRVQSMNEVQLPEGQLQEDAAFLAEFHYEMMLSDKMAKVVMEKSRDTNVTAIAKIILDDHQDIRAQLFSVIDRHGIILPYRLSENAYEKIKELKEEDEVSLNRNYLQYVIEQHQEGRENADDIIAQTRKTETILDLARLISAQSKVHEDMAKRYLEKLNDLSDKGYSYGAYSQIK